MAAPSFSRAYRLFRDPDRGMLAGVCAGIADFVGIEPIVIRLAFVLALVLFFVPAALVYVILAFALPKRPPALYASPEDEAFWERNINSWDMAAGYLIVREAGGKATQISGQDGPVHTRNILATNATLHEQMRQILAGAAGTKKDAA